MEQLKEILILTDNKISSKNQCLGIVNALMKELKREINFETYNVDLGFSNKMPNFFIYFLLKVGLININLKSFKLKPQLIVSCGRVTAPLNLFLKKKFRSNSMHIMNPYFLLNDFDIILYPTHDKKIDKHNIIEISGSIVNEKNLDLSRKEKIFFSNLLQIPRKKKIVSILVGGNSKKKYSELDIKCFVNLLKKIDAEKFYPCFLFSRRTPISMKNKIYDEFEEKAYIWDEKKFNPYCFLIKNSDCFVVTADSISMTSEALVSEKPVYIFLPKNLKSKINNFQSYLLNKNYTMKFSGEINTFKKKIKLNDKIAKKILSKISLV